MQNEQLLQKINSPADLKMLTLDVVCRCLSANGFFILIRTFSRRDQAADH